MDTTTTPQKNRRVSPRRKPKRGIRVTCQKGALGLGPNLAVSLLDVSETGIRMVVKAALEKGQEIEVGLQAINASRPLKVLATVVWSKAAIDGTWCLGARFQKYLSYADLLDVT